METVTTTPRDDLAALKAKRAHLRAWADDIATAVEALDPPETYADAERAARFVTLADRVILAIPSPDETPPANDLDLSEASIIAPARQRLRVYADKLLDTTTHLPMPKSFLEGERAGRCVLATDRMLVQLYTPPKAPKVDPLHDTVEDEAMDDSPEAGDQAIDSFLGKIDRATLFYVRHCGYWPDGTPYDAADTARKDEMANETVRGVASVLKARDDYEREKGPHSEADKGALLGLGIAQFTAWRANAIARATAEATGFWPEDHRADGTRPRGKPYMTSDPDPFAVSADYLTWAGKPVSFYGPPLPPGERHGPNGFPWWLVRRSDPPDTG